MTNLMNKYLLLFLLLSTVSCGQTVKKENPEDPDIVNSQPVEVPVSPEGYHTAYFASGCFWCAESIFKSVLGVVKVTAGYAGGEGKNPTYHTYSQMGYAETVAVVYDPTYIDFNTLLTVYFGSQNPVQQNGQGPDLGSGYRSIIFYQTKRQKKIIQQKIKAVQQQYARPIAAEVLPFQKFWKAEDYHQNFEEKHPNNPYIKQVSLPRLHLFQKQYPKLLKTKSD